MLIDDIECSQCYAWLARSRECDVCLLPNPDAPSDRRASGRHIRCAQEYASLYKRLYNRYRYHTQQPIPDDERERLQVQAATTVRQDATRDVERMLVLLARDEHKLGH